MWHVAPESKIQLVKWELSPKFPLGYSLFTDMRAIDAYIFWSLLFLLLSHALLTLSLKRTYFCRFSLSSGAYGHVVIR